MTLFILYHIYMLRKRHKHDIIFIIGGNIHMETMGERIKRLRSENNMTLEELGNKVGVGKSTVRKWENGIIANMRRDKIAKLADALNVSPAYLMGWKTPPTSSYVLATKDSKELIDIYVQLTPSNQNRVLTYSKNLFDTQCMEDELRAAHARTDIEAPPKGVQSDLDIMKDDSLWD